MLGYLIVVSGYLALMLGYLIVVSDNVSISNSRLRILNISVGYHS